MNIDSQLIDHSVTSIVISNALYGNLFISTFSLNQYTHLESVTIGNDCFGSVKTFQIDGLNRLKTIIIGSSSFTQVKQEWFYRYYNHEEWNSMLNIPWKSFHILNCESLESIQIDEYSFSDFGDFELRNLPQLQSITLGGGALCGLFNDDSCSLIMRSNNEMIRNDRM